MAEWQPDIEISIREWLTEDNKIRKEQERVDLSNQTTKEDKARKIQQNQKDCLYVCLFLIIVLWLSFSFVGFVFLIAYLIGEKTTYPIYSD